MREMGSDVMMNGVYIFITDDAVGVFDGDRVIAEWVLRRRCRLCVIRAVDG